MAFSNRLYGRTFGALSVVVVAAVGYVLALPKHGKDAEPAAQCHNYDTLAASDTWEQERAAHVEKMERIIFPHLIDTLTPVQQDLLLARIRDLYYSEPPAMTPAMLCFAPGTPDVVVEAFAAVDEFEGRYNQTNRWSTTASGSTGSQGNPITLTYGFPADGVNIPVVSGVGFAAGPNELNAWLNSRYGSQAAWKPIFDSVFNRWSQLSGITYVYEPNDDGVSMHQNTGVLGVRADVRIGAKQFVSSSSGLPDGNGNVLAYNNFPNDGDMVLDAFDTFYNDTSGNSLKLRNVVSHEHGHGTGQLHVCPINQSKLMEPFISTAYDGPRHDDVRNMQRHYGDPFEPDNNPAQATDLGDFTIGSGLTVGTVPLPSMPFGSLLSIDANGEQDYFFFEVNAACSVTVTVTPIGTTYDDSDQACPGQSGSCCSGNNFDSLSVADLNVDVIGQNGVTILAAGNSSPAGQAETLTNVQLTSPGGYFFRVYEGNTPTSTQLYRLNFSISAPVFQPPSITLPNGAPTLLIGGEPKSFDVQIDPGNDSVVGGSRLLFYRYDGGAFQSVPLASLGGNLYSATLPAPTCSATPQFYLSVTGVTSGQVTNPAGGPSAPFTASIGPIPLIDNFQTDKGWTTVLDGGDGLWQRGVPVNCNRGDPPSDFDGSGQCYLTDNDPNNCNSDVDDGSTTLTSPPFSMGEGDVITYAYWFNDFTGGLLQGGDSLRVEIATDSAGTNWATVRNYTTALNAWRTDTITVGVDVGPSQTMRIRFTANDIGTQNVVEAAIDAFVADGPTCQDPIETPDVPTGVTAEDGASCTEITVGWSASAGAVDYQVYRGSVDDPNAATQLATGVLGTGYVDSAAPVGETLYYWVKACNTSGCSDFSASDAGFTLSPPGVVSGLTATDDTICGAIEVSWNAAVDADAYVVRRNSLDDFDGADIIGNTAATSFRDGQTDHQLTYYYWVTASNECGEGEPGLADTGSASQKGDFNFDGFIDGADIQSFVEAMLGELSTLECADLDAPLGILDDNDIAAMISLLLSDA